MTRREELLARLENLKNSELREEVERYTHAEQENAVEFALALEALDPVYATPNAAPWFQRALDLLEMAQRLDDEAWNLTNEEWEEIDQVLNNPPDGLNYEKLCADLKLAQDKLNRTA